MTSLWFHASWGAVGVHGFFGSYRTANRYWSRSTVPAAARTTDGTLPPWPPRVGRGLRDVGRRVGRVALLEPAAPRRLVEPRVLRPAVALPVERAVEAAPRLDLRARRHGAADRVVRDGERDAARGQLVLA